MSMKDLRLLSLATLLGAAACGDNGTDVTTDLSQAEAQALAMVVANSAIESAAFVPDGPPAGAPALAPWSYSDEIAASNAPCEFGGTVDLSVTASANGDDEEGWVEATLSLTQIHDGCVAESDDGIRFTLTGAPQVSADLELLLSEEAIAIEGAYGGAVHWETDGRSGTCTIDFDVDLAINPSAMSGSVVMGGTVCGISIARSVTFNGA